MIPAYKFCCSATKIFDATLAKKVTILIISIEPSVISVARVLPEIGYFLTQTGEMA